MLLPLLYNIRIEYVRSHLFCKEDFRDVDTQGVEISMFWFRDNLGFLAETYSDLQNNMLDTSLIWGIWQHAACFTGICKI